MAFLTAHLFLLSLGAALVLVFHRTARRAADVAEKVVSDAGPIVPSALATEVRVADVALDAFDDSQLADELATRIAGLATMTHVKDALWELEKLAIKKRFSAKPGGGSS